MEVLNAHNWTRWRVQPGASLFRDCPDQDQGLLRAANVNLKKLKKGRTTKTTTTPTHNVFRHSELDTVVCSARRIFLCEGGYSGTVQKHAIPTIRRSSENPKNKAILLSERSRRTLTLKQPDFTFGRRKYMSSILSDRSLLMS